MIRKFVPLGASILVVLSLLLASCTAAPTPTIQATVDTNLIYTQAVETVQAGINATASARPPATATLEPTVTLQPTSTLEAPRDLPTVAPEVSPTDGGTATNTPAAAANPPAAQPSGDTCEWVDQSPRDGSLVKKDASWDTTIVVKNSGTSTWDKTYALKFWGGDRLGSPGDYFLTNDVKPGEMYRFVFTMKASNDTGKKQANWVIQNGSGQNFCPLYLQVEVVD